MILAGIDEAGYGPTLGPLVVSLAALRVPGAGSEGGLEALPDLWKMLSTAVTRKPDRARIPVNDSKKLFNQKKGLGDLEEGVLPFVRAHCGGLPRSLRSLLETVARRAGGPGEAPASPGDYLDSYAWYRGKDVDTPVETFANVVERRAEKLTEALQAAGAEVLELQGAPVEVLELNRGFRELDNKALVSFRVVGGFLRTLWQRYRDEPVEVYVDRQGGRAHYARPLFDAVTPRSVRILEETEAVSSYELSRKAREGKGSFRVVFATECEERCLPVALASMVSKYLRELHMVLFNRFWTEHCAELRPTAGYALDARRFLGEIEPTRSRLGIDREQLVRHR